MKRRIAALAGLVLAAAVIAAPAPIARSQTGTLTNPDELIVQAREALRVKDRVRLSALRAAAAETNHPLVMWVEYFELGNRLGEAQQPEVEAFMARWAGTYVEDRLRNDWLLELGRRRDWANFRAEVPRFRMNDDREVTCYSLLVQHQDGQDVRNAARSNWYAQRDLDEGCHAMAQALFEARRLTPEDVWQEIRLSVEHNRRSAARAAALMLGTPIAAGVDAVFQDPARALREWRDPRNAREARDSVDTKGAEPLAVLALWRLAANDVDAAASQLEAFEAKLTPGEAAQGWAGITKQAAFKLHPKSADFARRAFKAWDGTRRASAAPTFGDETLAAFARAALRQPAADAQRWNLLLRSIDAMSAAEQREPAWAYWKARAGAALAAAGPEGEGTRGLSKLSLESLASQAHNGAGFYGQLALEDLGRRSTLPVPAAELAGTEVDAARTTPGLDRALQLIAAGLRSEGVREWNFTLRGMGDRELLAAAALACAREVWDRCINTSDRTKAEVQVAQRFPTPFRDQVLAKAREVGVDPAYVYGLIRQESRFVLDARSHVGASGLMQLMPATARWTAKKVGIDWRPDLIVDRDVNLMLGMTYLKLLTEDFGGSGVMAAAAYNAGPSRPRRWREGGAVEAAAWVESIPFNETRDYVKKVLSNALVYAAVLGQPSPPTLKARLGGSIGPRDPNAPAADGNLP